MSEEASGRALAGTGWSAEPEPQGVSALTGDHPSRGDLMRMVDALQGAHIDMGSPWHWNMEQARKLALTALAVQAETRWRTISTAPTGRDILAGTFTSHGYWRQAIVYLAEGIFFDWPYGESPTVWAEPPLPPAPTAEARRAETGTGSVHEDVIGVAEAPQPDPTPKGE